MKILVTEVRVRKESEVYINVDVEFKMGCSEGSLPFTVTGSLGLYGKDCTNEIIKEFIIEKVKKMMSENEIHFEGNNILGGSDVIKIERA